MKQKHKWEIIKRNYPKYTSICKCGLLREHTIKPPYEIQYINTETGEIQENAGECILKNTNQIKLF